MGPIAGWMPEVRIGFQWDWLTQTVMVYLSIHPLFRLATST